MRRYFVLLIFLLGLFVSETLSAQRIDTLEVYSAKMDRSLKNIVVLPQAYDLSSDKRFPVIYLLHGYGGNFSTWLSHTKRSLPQDASRWEVIIVCPEGENSWYWDSPKDPKSQFETYVSIELVDQIDKKYKTIANAKARAVTGFSMGGHGALWLGMRHPDVFGVCGSMSGGVDIRPFPNSWEMKKQLGAYSTNYELWDRHTVINLVDSLKPDKLAIIIDCGVDDFFYDVNQKLHNALLSKKIPHDYTLRPGGHTHDYWNKALDYQLMFFSKFFNQK